VEKEGEETLSKTITPKKISSENKPGRAFYHPSRKRGTITLIEEMRTKINCLKDHQEIRLEV